MAELILPAQLPSVYNLHAEIRSLNVELSLRVHRHATSFSKLPAHLVKRPEAAL